MSASECASAACGHLTVYVVHLYFLSASFIFWSLLRETGALKRMHVPDSEVGQRFHPSFRLVCIAKHGACLQYMYGLTPSRQLLSVVYCMAEICRSASAYSESV